jgi:hypothetical protein
MIFNEHFNLAGKHAFLSASKNSWLNYDDEKFDQVFANAMTAAKGTRLHAFAAEAIRLGIRLPKTPSTLNMYVNDCIRWGMAPEVVLMYSDNAFGTADAISFKRNVLRISDLKNGVNQTNEIQLEVYAAFFCLEYDYKPFELDGIELRIYQNDEIREYDAEATTILSIMSKIITFDKRIKQLKEEAEL